MSEKRFILAEDSNGLFSIFDNEDSEDEPLLYGARFGTEKIVDLLNEQQSIIRRDEISIKTMMSNMEKLEKENEQLKQKIQRWKNLYELKDAEVTARVDALNRVCNYYLTEVQFKGETDPNEAVKEVINEILNAPIYEEWLTIFNKAHLEMKLSDETHIHINGIVTEYETSIEYPVGYRETTVTIREKEPQQNLMQELRRCNPIFKEEKEDKSMSVKIKKQPKEITIEELQKGDEYEEVIIHINEEKREEIENKYGVDYNFASKILLSDDEIKFKENYLTTRFGNVPYEIISKIEVVEKWLKFSFYVLVVLH